MAASRVAAETAGMSRRLIAAVLWFAVVWVGYEIAWSLAGVPRGVGPVIASAVAAFIAVDPLRLFFARIEPRSLVSDQTAGALGAQS
jgi:hypothetical protein